MCEKLGPVLFLREQIQSRIKDLADEISGDYEGKDLVLISVLRGGIIFLADLSRQLTVAHEFDLMGASSYKGGVTSQGHVEITKDVELPLEGRDVLLVEDIYDSGLTLQTILDYLTKRNPRSLEICVLLNKEKPHNQPINIRYIGFTIPDIFVVGFGLDYQERYRHLDCIHKIG